MNEERCECGAERQLANDPSMRKRWGALLHAPWCPIGKRERDDAVEREVAEREKEAG